MTVTLPFDPSIRILLIVVALVSGIGITTIGPGGIFVTIALYSLTPVSSGTVAGTTQVAFVATGLAGSAMYARSGEMSRPGSRTMAVVLSLSSVGGALLGAYLNAFVSRELFGVFLGSLAAFTGSVLVYREYRGLRPFYAVDASTTAGRGVLGVLGFGLGVASGLLGVGGPVIGVPALVLVGVPMLAAVAVAQVQSVFIAAFAASGYLLQNKVAFPLAVLVGVPLLVGVVLGWGVAHRVDPARLKVTSGVVLFGVGIYLVV